MQVFLSYAKQPSNYEDFRGLFDEYATFKFERPAQAQRKAFFEEEFPTKIMGVFYAHLRRAKVFSGSDAEIAAAIERKEITHDDIVDAFFNWLQREDNVFIYIEKPKTQSKSTPMHPYTPLNAPSQGSSNNKNYNNAQKYPEKKSQPYIVEKIAPSSKGTHHTTSHPQKMHPSYPTQQVFQLPPPPIGNNDMSARQKFTYKLADCFQFPERWNSLRNELTTLLVHLKRN